MVIKLEIEALKILLFIGINEYTLKKLKKNILKIKLLQKLFNETLEKTYAKAERVSIFNQVLEFYFQINRLQIALEPELVVTKEEATLFFKILKRLKNNEPIQYIIGETDFFGIPVKVTTATLIPRPETEALVQWILDDSTTKKPQHDSCILDIGTGSGAIAIALAKHIKNAKITALDLSESALQIARENAKLNNVSINFIQEDILNFPNVTKSVTATPYDVIVSNPPYVTMGEKSDMHLNVVAFEPHLALFVEDDNPLLFYKSIADFASNYLNQNGVLYVELNSNFAKETVALFQSYKFNTIQLKKDQYNRNRMLKATR